MSTRAVIHVVIDEEMNDRLESLVDKGSLSKSEIVRRTLQYGIKEMELAVDRFITRLENVNLEVLQKERENER